MWSVCELIPAGRWMDDAKTVSIEPTTHKCIQASHIRFQPLMPRVVIIAGNIIFVQVWANYGPETKCSLLQFLICPPNLKIFFINVVAVSISFAVF